MEKTLTLQSKESLLEFLNVAIEDGVKIPVKTTVSGDISNPDKVGMSIDINIVGANSAEDKQKAGANELDALQDEFDEFMMNTAFQFEVLADLMNNAREAGSLDEAFKSAEKLQAAIKEALIHTPKRLQEFKQKAEAYKTRRI